MASKKTTKRAPRTIRTISSKTEPVVKKRQALNAGRGDMFYLDAWQCLIAGVDTDDGPDHPCYQKHATRPVKDAFVQSFVRNNGNLQLIVVWKDPEGKIYVVAGRRRVVGIRLANKILAEQGCELLRVKAIVVRDKPHQLLGIKIEENEHRADTGALDKARDANQYIQLGRSLEETALRFGTTTTTVSNWLRLLELAPAVQQSIEEGTIAPTTALKRCYGKSVAEQAAVLSGPPPAPKGRQPGPTKGTVKKLLENGQREKMHPEFIRAMRFFLGELSAKEVGLDA